MKASDVDPFAFPIDAERYRTGDHSWLGELDHVSVHVGEPHQRMSTRSIDPSEWLIVDEHYERETALRRRLVAEAPQAVHLARDDSAVAGRETALLIRDWLSRHHPSAMADDDSWGIDGHPLVRAGTAVQEDLCIMQRRRRKWRLTAGLVCFPTHWDLGEKFDRPQEKIHGPVPHYATDLAGKVNNFFDRLGPEKVVSRRNWGFSAHPLLFLPRHTDLASAAVDGPESIWFRSERQTLRRLVVSDAILFTIKVQLAPMTALLEHRELCGRLAQSLRSFSPAMVADRGSSQAWMDDVILWLADNAN